MAAEAVQAASVDPVPFRAAEISRMVSDLPRRRPVEDLLGQLADALAEVDRRRVSLTVAWLQAGSEAADPGAREGYRRAIKRLGLLRDHPALDADSSADLYLALLRLAFAVPLLYAGYCADRGLRRWSAAGHAPARDPEAKVSPTFWPSSSPPGRKPR